MKQGHNGFTRTEMVVMIVGLALLLGLLGMGAPRDNARFSVCKMNLMQIGLANIRYAQDYNGRLCPGDFWNGTTIKYTTYTPYNPVGWVNLGWLLFAGQLPWPMSVNHVFFCPSDSYDGYEIECYDYSRCFEKPWPGTGNIKDCGYTYRDSYDGGAVIISGGSQGFGAPMEKMGTHALVTDFAEWGYNAQWGSNKGTHDRRYNVLLGDGSVTQIEDRAAPFPVTTGITNPKTQGLTNWIMYGTPYNYNSPTGVAMDYQYFDAVDYILNKSYYDPPRLVNEPAHAIPRWRL